MDYIFAASFFPEQAPPSQRKKYENCKKYPKSYPVPSIDPWHRQSMASPYNIAYWKFEKLTIECTNQSSILGRFQSGLLSPKQKLIKLLKELLLMFLTSAITLTFIELVTLVAFPFFQGFSVSIVTGICQTACPAIDCHCLSALKTSRFDEPLLSWKMKKLDITYFKY